MAPDKKIITPNQFKNLDLQDKKKVFTNGCFDVIHYGHAKYLYDASKLGDILIIGLNSDNSVKRLKGNDRPINNVDARSYLLASFYFVDYVIIFEEDTPFDLINIVKPNVLVKGGDYKIDNIVGGDVVKKLGGEVIVLPFVDGFSSTKIINQINSTYGKK
ncbi:MAG: D-glycero-beta-D-manno-heptose 1-phosphate adenylyltransferase [Bacteroidales bacterium]|jgi:rfaE bifunctional protein nucleotidyltransferase chain/domain